MTIAPYNNSIRCISRACLVTAIGFLVLATAAQAAPSVTNVVASQRSDGTGIVDVYYTLSGAASPTIVSVTFSNDGGATWNVLPTPSRLSGDVGPGLTNGPNKHIVWDAARDKGAVYWPNARARVTASELGQTITVSLPGGVPLELVRIPAGSFLMGSVYDPPYHTSGIEGPVHRVTINYDFLMTKYEITQGQWFAVMNGFPSTQPAANVNLPVAYVSWNDAQAFIAKLNTLGVGTFRLPSEAEWEYACRAGTSTRWYFGDGPEAELGNYAWYSANNTPSGAKVVGQKLPNPFGLYDMHGNVWEWVEDWFHSTYEGAPTDGSAWVDPAGTYRVLRGGAFSFSAAACRSASRNSLSPVSLTLYGVRLVRTP